MPTRSYNDVYTLDARFPEDKVKAFAKALTQLNASFKNLKKTAQSGFGLGRVFGSQQRSIIDQYNKKLGLTAEAIKNIGKAVTLVSPKIAKLRTDLQQLSEIKVKPEVAIQTQEGAPTSTASGVSAQASQKQVDNIERLRTALRGLGAEAIEAFSALNSGYERLATSGPVMIQLQGRLASLTGLQRSAADGAERYAQATMRSSVALQNSNIANREQVAELLRVQAARDQQRVQVERTISEYERENGILAGGKRVRRDIIQLIQTQNIESEKLNEVLRRRLDALRQLDRAEKTAAANRRALVAEEKALAAQRATESVARAVGGEQLQARDAEKAIRAVSSALKGFSGNSREAAAAADRLTQSFAQQANAASTTRQAVTRDRYRLQQFITNELVKQVQGSKLITKEDTNRAAITKRVSDEIVRGNIARKDGLRIIEQEVSRQRDLQKLGPETSGISQFAQLTLLAVVTSRIEQSIRSVVNAFAEFEQQLTEVRKTASATREQMDALGREMLDLGQEVPIPAQELAQIAGVLGQVGALDAAGKGVEEFARSAREAVRLVAEVALATDLTAEDAAKSFGQLRAVFASDVERIQQQLSVVTGRAATVTDALRAIFGVLNEVSNATVATVGDLQSFIQNFGGVASAAGVAVEKVAALGGAIRDLGVSPQVAGTALSRLFQEAQRKAEVFAEVLGVTTEEWVDLFTTDANEAILQFLEGLDALGSAEQARVLTSLAARQRLRNTIIKLSQATSKQAEGEKTLRDRIEETTSLITNYNSVADEATKFSETWNASINRLQNAITSIGNAMRPVLTVVATFIDAISGLITFFTNIPVLGAFVTSLAAIGVVVLAVQLKLKLFRLTLNFMSGGLAEVAAALGFATQKTVENTAATDVNTVAKSRNTAATAGQARAVTASSAAIGAASSKTVVSVAKVGAALSTLALVVGQFVGGTAGTIISTIGGVGLALQLLWPILRKTGVLLLALKAKFIALGGGITAVKLLLLAAGKSILGVFTSAVVVVTAKIVGFVVAAAAAVAGIATLGVAIYDLVTGSNELGESISRVALGTGNFLDYALTGFARFSDWLTFGAVGANELYNEMVKLGEAMRQIQSIAAEGVTTFLKGSGLDEDERGLAVEGISAGAEGFGLASIYRMSGEELKALVANNKVLLQDIRKVRAELAEKKSAEDIAEIFQEEALTAKRLVEISKDYNVTIKTRVDEYAKEVEATNELKNNMEKYANEAERASLRVDRLRGAIAKIAAEQDKAFSSDDIIAFAYGQKESKDIIADQVGLVLGLNRELKKVTDQRKDALARQREINNAIKVEEFSVNSIRKNLKSGSIGEAAGKTALAIAKARLSLLQGQLQMQEQIVTKTKEEIKERLELQRLALERRDRLLEQAEAEAAEAELERRKEMEEDAAEFISKVRERTARSRDKFEKSSAEKAASIIEDYHAKVKELEEKRYENAAQNAEAYLAIEENLYAQLSVLYAEDVKKSLKAREEALKEEKKVLDDREKEFVNSFKATAKAAEREIKKLEKEIKKLEKEIKNSATALEAFDKGLKSILSDLGDPFTKLASGIEKSAKAAEDLVRNAAKTGDLERVSAALELGAEAIRRSAFEAGKALAKLAEERNKLNEDAGKLSESEQSKLVQFREAFQRNLGDQNIDEVERGRRAQVLRQRAGDVFGEDGEAIALRLADVLENERQLAALKDQTELQRRLVELTEAQTEAFKTTAKALTEREEGTTDAALIEGIKEAFNEAQQAGDTPTVRALRESIAQQQTIIDRVAAVVPAAQDAQAIPAEEIDRQIEAYRNLQREQELNRRLMERNNAIAKSFNENFTGAYENLGEFSAAIERWTKVIQLQVDKNFTTDVVDRAEQARQHSDRTIRQQAEFNRRDGSVDRGRAAGLATSEAEEARIRLLQSNRDFLQYVVDREKTRAKRDADLSKEWKAAQKKLQELEAAAQNGGN